MTKQSKKEDLFTRVRLLDRLTPTEKKIVSFFEKNPRLPAFDNLTALSAKAGASKASMIRFLIHRLGYRDFAEFRAERQGHIENQLESPIKRYLRRRAPGGGTESNHRSRLERHMGEVLRHMETAGVCLDETVLEQTARLMARSDRTLYVLGQRTSHALAYMLVTNLQYVRPKVCLMGDGHSSLPAEMFNVSAGDVAFVISRRRYAENTDRIARYLSDCGLTLVLATDSEVSPLSPLADLRIVLPPAEGAAFESLAAWVTALEALALMVAELCRENETAYARKAEGLVSRFYGLHEDDDQENERG